MNQRQTILNAWERRRKLRPASPQLAKAQAFFDLISQESDRCWPDLVTTFRRSFSDAYDEIVPVLLDTDDPLVIYNTTQVLDMNNPKDADVAKRVVAGFDSQKHLASMLTLAKIPELQPALRQKASLPQPIRDALNPAAPA
jgi:hypothetical protein